MAPQSSTLAWKIPCTEGPGGLQSMGFLRVGHNWASSLSLSCIGEGNGNPLQCSCLENPRDGGAWWAAVYGVTQSRTRLKLLSSTAGSKAIKNSQVKSFPTPSHEHIYLTILTGCPTLAAGFPGSSAVQNRLPVQEKQVHSLGGEDPLEKETATHSRILAWKIPQTEEPGGLQTMHGVAEVLDMT